MLTAATAIGASSMRDTISGYIRRQPDDSVTVLEMSALRAPVEGAPDSAARVSLRRGAGFAALAADCAARFRTRLALPRRAAGDWSIELPDGGCGCQLCDTLRAFLTDSSRRTFDWPIKQESRRHVHSRIDMAELPVTHVTRRTGSPYALVLSKTDALFDRERQARTRDETDLEWLTAS
jgi:hypothetical protein